MNAISCILCYFILIQMINVCAVYYDAKLSSYSKRLINSEPDEAIKVYPYHFGYKYGQKLNMVIVFKNVAPTMNILLTSSNDDRFFDIENTKPDERWFYCNGTLQKEKYSVQVKLHINSVACLRYIIFASREIPNNNDDDACLDPSKACNVEVDLKNECADEPIPAKTSCYREIKQYVCILNTYLIGATHKWYHDYGDEKPVIGYIPPLKASITKLIITLEKIDDNTYIYSTLTDKNGIEFETNRTKLQLFANESGAYSDVTILKYGLKEDIMFDCGLHSQENEYIQIGFINTTNTISTYNGKWIKNKFNMAYNGTMLCCIIYKIFNGGKEKYVERFIENRTILLYDESLNLDPSHMSEAAATFKDNILYIVISILAVGVVILMVVIIIYIKKCYCQNNKPEESLELDTYDSANRVIYADLSLAGGQAQRPVHKEESPYAQIIGVIKPSSKNV